MLFRIEGTVTKIHGEEWLIVAELDGGFCLAVKNKDIVPARIYLVYCRDAITEKIESDVTL